MNTIAIPDLRFEQSFTRSLNSYAIQQQESKIRRHEAADVNLEELNAKLDEAEQQELQTSGAHGVQPIGPITPGIVIYAIIKDQILMPFIQGFFLTGVLIAIKPFLNTITAQGQRCGIWLANGLGLNRLNRNPFTPI
ncbi:hypothetical protein HYPBUDRAFT_154148 [Hyphopichia burtonii NRRL Y-1933]|uniref:Uncharacterized protein n=2 Tax=Dikarya TaxID=451864 RepID=A0A1E4RC35_9ASCO|nr:hypothetical protein HYPBUDRAFT_154148 [Hyphopichia burtonii NRRL Y-1933]ODV64810.1 hypothetical protein HYPBUDRAFT_154148 [Hyphopichia burtonii NRRL Y-1933]